MSSVHASIKRYPILFYYLLAFLLSWAGILTVIAANRGLPANQQELEAVLPVAIFSMLGGPSLAGLLSIALVDGKPGFRDLWRRLRAWRCGWRWWAIAVFLAPVLLLATWLVLSVFSPVFIPGVFTRADAGSWIAMGLGSAIATGFLEELGWTGFVLPKLRQRHSVFKTGLIIGVLHGLWHILPMAIWPAVAYAGEFTPALYVVIRSISFLVGGLVAFRILMVWVYDHAESLLLLSVMHVGLTAANIIFNPEGLAGTSAYIADLVGILTQWLVVAVVAWKSRGIMAVPRAVADQAA